MIKIALSFAFAAALISTGCGKKDADKGGEQKTEAAKPAADEGPAIDCAAFETKMTECLEPFAAAYAKTEFGGKSGKKVAGGPVDEELAAKNFKTLWSLASKDLCAGGPAVMDTPFVKRDGRWKERFNSCDATAACDAWVPCMATAMGELLPAR